MGYVGNFRSTPVGPLTREAAAELDRVKAELLRILNLNVVPPLVLIPNAGSYTLLVQEEDPDNEFCAELDTDPELSACVDDGSAGGGHNHPSFWCAELDTDPALEACEQLRGDDVWVKTDDGAVKHLEPYTSTDYPDPEITHETGLGFCGFSYDDAGHVTGHWDINGDWQSTWGFSEPV
jgi:hypothetical protein